MALSDTVSHQVETLLRTFCERKIPPDVRDQIKLTYAFRANTVTLYEDRPRWDDPDQWTHRAIAQFRFDRTTGQWTLYWADRNTKWSTYADAAPTSRFDLLLNEVDRDTTGIFFG